MKKAYLYPVVGVVSALITVLIATLAAHQTVFIGILIAILSGATGVLIARLAWAIVKKEIYDSFIASEVWGFIGTGLYGWFIFNTSEAIQTSLVFAIICCTVNASGFRFIAEKNEKTIVGAAKVEPTKKEKVAQLASTLRYRFMDDGVTPNLDAPLCVDEDGRHLTPVEAEEKGLGAMYAEAIEYIKTIVR